MTYLEFHFLFTLPIAVLLTVLVFFKKRFSSSYRKWGILTLIVLAFVYTTPWDNYLVYKGIWGYPEGSVLGVIGYVPIEEYFFFFIQTWIAGMFYFLVKKVPNYAQSTKSQEDNFLSKNWIMALIPLAFTLAGFYFCQSEKSLYLGLILAWGSPIFLIQVLFGGDLLIKNWKRVFPSIFILSLYFWVADGFAIHNEAWNFNWTYLTEITFFGIPIEEMSFFVYTNTMVVFGLDLFENPESLMRAQSLFYKGGPSAKPA